MAARHLHILIPFRGVVPSRSDTLSQRLERPPSITVWKQYPNRSEGDRMKYQNTLYWILTSIMAAFMSLGATADVLRVPTALAWFIHLGYPSYLLPFIGTAKIVGVITVLVPGTRRLKEWAYAGLVFDLVGAFYSHISVGDQVAAWIFPLIGLLLVTGSYAFYRKRTGEEAAYLFASSIAAPNRP